MFSVRAVNTEAGYGQKCHIFSNTIYNEITRYCQIDAKLMPKLSLTD